jgi:serine protease AprX
MKKYLLLLIFFLSLCMFKSNAQFSRYIIRLKNKTGTPFSISDPLQFLTQRSIDRRTRYSIPVDETDLPINPGYLESIQSVPNVSIINTSKWLNQVCISTTDDAALAAINNFTFVESSSPVGARINQITRSVNKQLTPPHVERTATPSSAQSTNDFFEYGASLLQVRLHNAEFLHNYGFRGQGMQVCITDDGFYHYTTLPTFDSARINNQILGTWDFVKNDSIVDDDDSHGMKCFSTISANMPGIFVGTAPAASYYLYRTEDIFSETPVEQQNWAAATERADSLGVDVVSVSLGYTTFDNSSFDYTYDDMTGNKTMMARAANLAAKKGMLVVAAAGNDGGSAWHYISTVGDADSALTIGAVNANRESAGFSSYGPNSDGQVKPDIAAIGEGAAVASSGSGIPVSGNGTSFACPIMAGIATCLWQAFPEIKNMDFIEGIRQSSDRYANPDDRTGYGIPDVKHAFVSFIKQLHTQSAFMDQCNASFMLSVKASEDMSVVIERKLPSDTVYVPIKTQVANGTFATRVLNYTDNLVNYTSGVLIRYRVKMNIGTDTSFYLDSATLFYETQCNPVTEEKLCSGASAYFSVNAVHGYTNKWQVDTGNGFTDIANNSFYSGASTNVLIAKNLPQNFYGYKYRCVQTNGTATINNTPITVKFTSNWTGAVSTAWEDAANWSCSIVPNQYIDVVIPGSAINFPIVSSNANCHSLITSAGADVTVKNGFTLSIAGH